MSPEFTVLNIYFLSFSIFEQLALSLKSSIVLKFSLCWNIFYRSGFCATCACPENRVCPEIFHSIEYALYTPYFWATFACPEKESVPWNHCIKHMCFIIQKFWGTCVGPENRFCLEIFTALNYLWSFRIFEHLLLYLKRCSLHWNFSSPRGCPPPASHAYGLEYMGILSGRQNGHLSPWWLGLRTKIF